MLPRKPETLWEANFFLKENKMFYLPCERMENSLTVENRCMAPRSNSHVETKGLSSLKIIWRFNTRVRVPRDCSSPGVPRESPLRQVQREDSFYDGKRRKASLEVK